MHSARNLCLVDWNNGSDFADYDETKNLSYCKQREGTVGTGLTSRALFNYEECSDRKGDA